MQEVKYRIDLSGFDLNILINGMNDFRNSLIEKDIPSDDVDRILLKLINSHPVKVKRYSYEER